VPQQADGVPYDEESNTEAIVPSRIEASESLKNLWHLFFRNTDSGVAYINPDARPAAPTTDDDAPPLLSVPDGIVY